MRAFSLIAVGADPEVFLVDKEGRPVSAEGLFGGTKHDPKPMGIGNGFNIQEDNVAAEYNIPPSVGADIFAQNIEKGLRYIHDVAKSKELTVTLKAALDFSEIQLDTPHCREMGCEPDFNVWTGSVNPRPIAPKRMRTAAAHAHFSWASPTHEQRDAFVKACDVYFGVPSILVTEKSLRRELYGKAGCFRPKAYGVEYRTPDNFWIGNREYSKHVYKIAEDIVDCLNNEGDMFLEEVDQEAIAIQHAINNHDRDTALYLMEKFGAEPFPTLRA